MKKMISVLLIGLLVLGIFPVLADEATGEELQQVLLSVKEKIEIPAEFKEFSYSVNENEKSGNSWRLRWSREAPDYETITVTADKDGEILSYFQSTVESAGLLSPEFSREQAAACAEEFLYRVNTTTKGRFFVTEVTAGMGIFQIQFEERINDIPVKGSSATVCVNKSDRKVSEMSLSRAYQQDNFPNPEKIISAEAAAAAYLKQIGFQLVYHTYLDYETKMVKAYPVFIAPKHNTVAIDAFTGQMVDILSDAGYDILYDSMKQESSASGSISNMRNEVILTEAELSEIAKTQPLLGKQQALELINRSFSEQFSIESAGLNRSLSDQDSYLWNLELGNKKGQHARATIDAQTGIIVSYHNYKEATQQETISIEQAKKKASALFRDNAGELSSLFRFSMESSEQSEKHTSLVYHRYENNIPIEDQTLRVSFCGDGSVESYQLTYHKNTQFVEMKEDTDPNTQKVFDAFLKQSSYSLLYVPVTKNNKTEMLLTYDFQASSLPSLDGNTLTPVNYRGEPEEKKTDPVYTDLSCHWVEKFVDILAYNNVYLIRENRFLPDQAVTAKEFVSLLSDAINPLPYFLRSRIEGVFSKEIVPEEEKDLPLSRQAAAKYIVKLLKYEKLAEKPEAFQYLFRDAVEEANRPYIMICYMLDIMKGDESGSFHADDTLTRAETAVILYNILK